MNSEEKEIFKKVLKILPKNLEIYNSYGPRTRDKFTGIGLCDVACAHLFDNNPNLFGITEHQGKIIRAYFHNNNQPTYLKELYKEFPRIFKGEPKEWVSDKNIPRF